MTAGDVSPLLNAFEAGILVDSPCPLVDAFRVEIAPDQGAVKRLTALSDACERSTDAQITRGMLNDLSWSLLDATLRSVPKSRLARSAAMTSRRCGTLSSDHARVLQAIEDACAAG
jgi:hypothetical protein